MKKRSDELEAHWGWGVAMAFMIVVLILGLLGGCSAATQSAGLGTSYEAGMCFSYTNTIHNEKVSDVDQTTEPWAFNINSGIEQTVGGDRKEWNISVGMRECPENPQEIIQEANRPLQGNLADTEAVLRDE